MNLKLQLDCKLICCFDVLYIYIYTYMHHKFINHCENIFEMGFNDYEIDTQLRNIGKMITLRMIGHQYICHE